MRFGPGLFFILNIFMLNTCFSDTEKTVEVPPHLLTPPKIAKAVPLFWSWLCRKVVQLVFTHPAASLKGSGSFGYGQSLTNPRRLM